MLVTDFHFQLLWLFFRNRNSRQFKVNAILDPILHENKVTGQNTILCRFWWMTSNRFSEGTLYNSSFV